LLQVIDDPSSDKMFLISEAMEGGSVLPDSVEAEAVPIWMVKVVMKQLIQAVQHLHSSGFAHRDIKPCNILWNRTRDIVKLSDFGAAFECARREDGTYDDTSRATNGTPAFTAPEMLLPSPFSTRSQDVWYVIANNIRFPVHLDFTSCCRAVGVSMYTMLFGRPPWVADSLPALYELIKGCRLSVPRNPGNPDWTQAIDLVTRFLDANPKSRITLDAAASHPFFAPLSISISTVVPKRTLPPFSPPQRSTSSLALSPGNGASSLDVKTTGFGDVPLQIKTEDASLYLSSTSEFDASMSGVIVTRPQSAASTDSNILGLTLVPEN
jgi:serine/threonine protein kinase